MTTIDGLSWSENRARLRQQAEVLIHEGAASETELTEDLAHYYALYKFAPAAYLVVSRDGRVTESNVAADALCPIASMLFPPMLS
ncbi:MAG TPA: hypothetical protein DHU56_10045 [Marinobacter sp.]|nr:hypothetical protein [Marinobacter sp.]